MAAGSAATSACLRFDPFGCQDDAQCDAQALGRCEASGWCSYPDPACGATGHRFEANAGDGLGGQCVGPDSTGTGPEPTGTGPEPPLDTGSDDTATTGLEPTDSTGDDDPTGAVCGGAGEACCPSEACEAGLECREGVCGCVLSVAVGDRHTCVVKLDGSVSCWGSNDLGQLATDPAVTPSSPVPLEVAGIDGVVELHARRHTCARLDDTTVLCWGDNAGSKVAVTDPAPVVHVPTAAPWGAPAERLGVGGSHTCVGRGAVDAPVCWGDNAQGQLTDAAAAPGPAFVAGGFEPFVIAMGAAHTCMSTLTGEIYCWGDNSQGQLAVDPAVTPTSGVPLALGLPPASTIAAGAEHTCAMTGTEVQCWGRNDLGQLGNGTSTGTFTPMPVAIPPGSGNVTALVAAADQTCVVLGGGAVQCWGGNQNGELLLEPDETGEDGFALSPRPIELGFAVAQLATGVTHSCALGTDGQVRCWGDNAQGQIGDGTVIDALEPTPAQISCP